MTSVLAVGLLVGMGVISLVGCTAVYASRVPPLPPSKNFSAMTCDQLLAEKQRIEAGYLKHNARMKADTRRNLSQLNGDALAVNDAVRFNSCRIETVRILKTERRTSASP